MYRIKGRDDIRAYGAAIAAIIAVAAFASNGSCFFDTKTTLCEASGLRCQPGQVCAADQDACVDIGGCGDGIRSGDELCDDGNIRNGDNCSALCDSDETCGNGVVDMAAGESCDHAAPGTSNCSSECKLEVCGNRILDPGESCDDGNQLSGDSCSGDCRSNEACGNGIEDRHLGEECEFSDEPFPRRPSDTATCDDDCTLPRCGDGHANSRLTPPEQCDPGLIVMGVPQDSSTCDSDCTPVSCGDGHWNSSAQEECDQGPGNSNTIPNACRTDCRKAHCGDGVRDMGEQCDDDNNINSDDCVNINGTCRHATCGDGYRDTFGSDTETCDTDSSGQPVGCNSGLICVNNCTDCRVP